MKIKLFSLFLALAMLAGMGSVYTAYAADDSARITGVSGSASIDVGGVYAPAKEPEATYYVTVSWEKMVFEYNVNGSRTWHPEDHSYVYNASYQWVSGQQKEVTVTNCSNKPINVTADFEEAANTYNITPKLDKTSLSLPVGEKNALVKENEGTFKVSADSKTTTPNFDTPEDGFLLGTLKLTVTPVTE